jgi:hypothetical protein
MSRWMRWRSPLGVCVMVAAAILLEVSMSRAAITPNPTSEATSFSNTAADPHGNAAAPSQWLTETVDRDGSMPAIQLGGDGEPRIAYYHRGSGSLRYATRRNGAWTSEIIATAAMEPGQDEYLILDPADVPHVFYGTATGELRYATRTPLGWTSERVAQTEHWYGLTAAVLDHVGQPHVFFDDNDELQYATRTAAGWTKPEGLPVFYPNPLNASVGTDGRIHLGINDDSDLKYGVRDHGKWTISPALYTSGGSVAVAVDPKNQPALCLRLDSGLSIGNQTGGAWQFEAIDPEGVLPLCMAVDRTHQIHILYGWPTLKYATHKGSKWAFEAVAPAARAGYMTIDGHGNPHIALDANGVQYVSRSKKHPSPGAPGATALERAP